MINHISIQNFATIENTEVDFDEGLNIITGETGAGKSIVIEAISLALGSRADSSYVRTGKDKAIIQLVGTLEGKDYITTREITANGKNLCKLNGEIVTLSHLAEVSSKLADIHGQYDNQSLLNPDNHILLLDSYRHSLTDEMLEDVRVSYSNYSEVKRKLKSLLTTEKDSLKRIEFLKYELAEIESVNPIMGEDSELEERISILQNSEKIFENVNLAYETMYGESPSVMEGLDLSLKAVAEISRYSKEFASISDEMSEAYYKLEDLITSLRGIKERITFSPSELDEAINRQELLNQLKRKYAPEISEILEYKEKIKEELSLIENFDENKILLMKEFKTQTEELTKKCERLSTARKVKAEELEAKIEAELKDLNFNDAKVKIRFEQLKEPQENGFDKIEIYITTNKGEDFKPLAKTISGGETSRIMLAFKNIVSSYDRTPTMIFDEIDSGISGITASIVGQKLKEISSKHQIICITHLPQIAACGKYNYMIKKESDDNSTYTSIERLSSSEKVDEIARLLGGKNITDSTVKAATELIEASK